MKFQPWLPKIAMFAAAMQMASCMGSLDPTPSRIAGVGSKDGSDSTDTTSSIPFEALPPEAYVNKVKNLLTGAAATSDEIDAVKNDPTALKGLIAGWQKLPGYQGKMVQFLSNAFQQSAVAYTDFADQGMSVFANVAATNRALLLKNLQEQMAYTVLMNDAAGVPFSSSLGGTTYAMTPPVKAYYAYVDKMVYTDADKLTNNNTGSTFAQIINAFAVTDFSNWTMTNVREPKSGEATTTAANAATATELVLNTQRAGFFTTPAFLAGWQTNLSNQYRATTNQAMIVALSHAIDGTNVSLPPDGSQLDAAHAAPNSSCFGCHVNLDPMRQFYRQAYTVHFTPQTDPNYNKIQGSFGFDKVQQNGVNGVVDFGKILSSHPRMAGAWVGKLCTFADDAACVSSEAEYTNVVNAFTSSNQSWSTLVQTLFSSPLVTYAQYTQTGAQNQAFPVAKRDHLCPLLSTRLGIKDACFQDPTTTVPAAMKNVQLIASILPANGYSRGTVLPVLANDPSLFFRAGLENVCAALSASVVDAGATTLYDSTKPDASIADMVHNFMGIQAPNDATPISILQDHFNQAMNMGSVKATDAMKSVFIAACLSPSVVGIGQ